MPCFQLAYAQETTDVWDVLRSEFKLTHEISRPEVQKQIRWLKQHPGYLYKVSRQAEPYIYHIVSEIKKRHLPGELALVPMIESAYDPFAYSIVGAAGLWQLMPKTGNQLGLKQDFWFDGRRSIGQSTNAALNYLVHLNKFFNGQWILAIAAYDAGEGSISRTIKATVPPGTPVSFWNLSVPAETKAYVPRLLALAEVIENPDQYHINLPKIPYAPYFEEVEIGSQIDLNHAAKLAGISYKELIKLNPGYNRWTTAPYKPFNLLIPRSKVRLFNWNLSNVSPEKRNSWSKLRTPHDHRLKNIAIRHHTGSYLIQQMDKATPNIYANTTSNNSNVQTKLTKDRLIQPLLSARNHRIIHIVQPQDSLAHLEKLYGIKAEQLLLWNKLDAHQALYQGQQLVIWKKITPPVRYTIKNGDTLNNIAKMYHTNPNKIIELNPELRSWPKLQVGQKILVG